MPITLSQIVVRTRQDKREYGQTTRETHTCPLRAYCHLHKTPPHCNTPLRNGLHQIPPPCGWWGGIHPLRGT